MIYHFEISYLLFISISSRGSNLLSAHLGTTAPIPRPSFGSNDSASSLPNKVNWAHSDWKVVLLVWSQVLKPNLHSTFYKPRRIHETWMKGLKKIRLKPVSTDSCISLHYTPFPLPKCLKILALVFIPLFSFILYHLLIYPYRSCLVLKK